jgi:hypothetical protein
LGNKGRKWVERKEERRRKRGKARQQLHLVTNSKEANQTY